MKFDRTIAGAAALIATVATISFAAPLRAETVRYSDLNIATAEGAAQLDSRLHRAAHKICGAKEAAIVTAGCRSRIVADAKQQLASAKPADVVLASR
jgi:UrcA family protein